MYIDNILDYSATFENYVAHVRVVLGLLPENHLYVKAEKCQFYQVAISFLGYWIIPQGVVMDERKFEVVRSWPLPSTIKGLQKFEVCQILLQLHKQLQLYRLSSHLKGGPRKLVWSPAANEAF